MLKPKISIVIPLGYLDESFIKTLKAAFNQTINPYELIVVDSSKNKKITSIIKSFKNKKIKHIKIDKSFPGRARNIGVLKSSGNIIAFLDSKTIPLSDWLKNSVKILLKDNYDIVFGMTKYVPDQNKQKLFSTFIYGNISHESTPGTVMLKNKYLNTCGFIENARAAEDIEWRDRLKKDLNYFIPHHFNTIYKEVPKSFFNFLSKFFIYSFHTSKISVQKNIKNFYFFIFIILSALIIPQWNYLIGEGGWTKDPLYIPNITKIYLIFILILLFYKYIFNFIKSNKKENLLINLLNISIIFISLFFFVKFNNFLIVNFDLLTTNFPNLFLIIVLILLILSFLYRGIFSPLIKKIPLKKILPFNWVLFGFFGIILDLFKSPGYLLGSLFMPIIGSFFYKNTMNNSFKYTKSYNKKILFVCPFPEGVQAGQRLKYEIQFSNLRKDNFLINVESFININTWTYIYKKGYFLKKLFNLIIGYFKRFLLINKLPAYDIVYVFMWVTPYGNNLFEKYYCKFSKYLVYDIEDNILIKKINQINTLSSRFKHKSKYIYLIKNADKIITSAPALSEICNKINNKQNSFYIPPSIDFKRYKVKNNYKIKKLLTIGWTGTFSSRQYLEKMLPIFKKLSKITNFKIIIISDFDISFKNLNNKSIKWTKENEIKDLQEIDIGIYPLPRDDEWVLGKSGLKSIQYMALGIPTVATNVGNVKKIIKHKYNGFLVNNQKEWIESLVKLLKSENLRKKIGTRARKTIIQNYSMNKIYKEYKKILYS